MTPEVEALVRALLAEALSLDPGNRLARFTLAQLDLRTTGGGADRPSLEQQRRHDRAVRDLTFLRDTAAAWAPGGWWRRRARAVSLALEGREQAWDDPFWYRATYDLAAELVHSPAFYSDPPAAAAKGLAQELVRAMERTLGWRAWARNRPLRQFLAGLEGPAIVFLARFSPPEDRQSEAPVIRSRLSLRRHIGDADGRSLVTFVETKLGPLTYRAAYNLACYHAENPGPMETDDGTAMGYFEEAMRAADGNLVGWAPDDPTLERIRRSPKFKTIMHEARSRLKAEREARDGWRLTREAVPTTPRRGQGQN